MDIFYTIIYFLYVKKFLPGKYTTNNNRNQSKSLDRYIQRNRRASISMKAIYN